MYLKIEKAAIEGDYPTVKGLWDKITPDEQVAYAEQLGKHFLPKVSYVLYQLKCDSSNPAACQMLEKCHDEIEHWNMAHD